MCGVRNSTKKHTVNLTVPSAGSLGEREHPPAKKSKFVARRRARTPNLLQTHSMECNECLNAKKDEIKREEKKTHNGRGRTMPPVRHPIVDYHGKRTDIGDASTGDGMAHLDETFEPIANSIERKTIEFR